MFDEYIRQSMKEIFASMVFMEIEAGDTVAAPPAGMDTALSSVVGLAGDLRGMLTVNCQKSPATAIASAMLGLELTELDADVRDALGEVTNMVAGGLKSALAQEGTNINIAVPTTIIGKGVRSSAGQGTQRLLVPFSLPSGLLAVELQYVMVA